jgi:polysaccharide export outer membrane protein
VGEVLIAGKTVTEAQDAIYQAMSPLFGNKDAYQVHVSLSGIRYTVLGECLRPGVHYLYLDRGTVMDALAYAGDMTFLADRRRVQVLRQTNETWQRFELDLTSAEVLRNPNFYLQPNDIITVRPLPQKSWGFGQTGFASFTSLLSVLSTTLTLYIALNR